MVVRRRPPSVRESVAVRRCVGDKRTDESASACLPSCNQQAHDKNDSDGTENRPTHATEGGHARSRCERNWILPLWWNDRLRVDGKQRDHGWLHAACHSATQDLQYTSLTFTLAFLLE